MLMKNSSDTIGNRNRDLPACSTVTQPTAPPRAFHQGSGNVMETDKVIYINFDKVQHSTGHEGRMGSNCTSLLFLQLRRVMGFAAQRKTPDALPPGNRPDTLLKYLHFCKKNCSQDLALIKVSKLGTWIARYIMSVFRGESSGGQKSRGCG